MPNNAARRCAIYARISVTSEESVSLARQVEAAEQYAAARGWQVVETFRDGGVSATHNKPEDRAGWRALLDSPASFDAVIIWKLDRLARRVIDFHLANQALNARDAALVAVENSIDMTTTDGKLVANVLASFAEYEADAISARVKAARTHLVRSGRVVGGTIPYGWRSVRNPDSPGHVLAQDPDRIDYVRGMVDRAVRGDTVYSIVKWLNDVGAPSPTGKGPWVYSTVERQLRHPVLAGMTPFNPDNATKTRCAEVLRDATGMPVVDESLAVLPVAEWRALVKKLDDRDSAQSKPVALRAKTSGLLSGLVYCGEHLDDEGNGTRMHRGTIQGRPGYYCPTCHHAVSNFEHVVVAKFLRQKGERVRWAVVQEVEEGGAALLPEIEARLDELDDLIRQAPDREARRDLQAQQANLLDLRDEKRAETPRVSLHEVGTTQWFAEAWADATEVEDQRAVLDDAVGRIWVMRGRPGRRSDATLLKRFAFEWKMPHDVGPLDETNPGELARSAR